MNKLSLNDLKNKYADRPYNFQQAEVEKLISDPIPVEPEVPMVMDVAPVQKRKRMSNTPLVGFLIFAGVTMFAGFSVLVNIQLNNSGTNDSSVLGEKTSVIEDSNSYENSRLEDESVDDLYSLNIGEENDTLADVLKQDTYSEDSTAKDFLINKIEKEIAEEKEEEIMGENLNSEIESNVEDHELEDESEDTELIVKEVSGGYANLRQSPLSGPISRVSSGSTLEILSEDVVDDYTWYEVKTDSNITGWIRGDLVEKL